MDMNTYQGYASSTAVYPESQVVVYPVLGLAIASVLVQMKHLRGDGPLDKEAMALELGDCLWFISQAAADLGYTLEEIAEMNVSKLQKRAAEGTIKGTGDNR